MKKLLIILTALLIFSGITPAQSYKNSVDSLWSSYQIKRGEKLYNQMRYSKVVSIYQPYSNRKVLNDSQKRLLAQSYLNIANYEMAENTLRSMDSASMVAQDYYTMAQCLKYQSKYQESDRWLASYKSLNQSDSRLKYQTNSSKEVDQIKKKTLFQIELLPANSSESDFGAVPYGLDLVFASSRPTDDIIKREYGWNDSPYLNVFVIDSDTSSQPNAKIFNSMLKTAFHDGPVAFNRDQTEMFVTQNPYSFFDNIKKRQVNNFQLFLNYKLPSGDWSALKLLPFNGKDFSTGHASISPDGSRLWFASDRPGGLGRSDIYYVDRVGDGWSEPVNAGADINTEGDEMFPFIAPDGKLYFASNGHLTLGGLDIQVAQKRGGGYTVENYGFPVNSAYDDFSLYLNEDGKSGYFASNRPEGKGSDDIYRFDVLDIARNYNLVLKDSVTQLPISGQSIKLLVDGIEKTLNSDSLGSIIVEPTLATHFVAICQIEGYQPLKRSVDVNKDQDVYELLLVPLPVWGVYGSITDLTSGMGVDSVQVTIESVDITSRFNALTLGGGKFSQIINPETDYKLVLSSPNYFTKRANFTTKGRAAGWININEFIQTTIERVEMNKVIEIPNIYYDLGKWNIRKDASVELDKVVQFLNDNPNIKIELGSHTDSRGSAESNLSLSQKRAQSAVDYIVTKGEISKDRIVAKGYGESSLKNSCADGVKCSEEEHQQNRRTEIKITGVK